VAIWIICRDLGARSSTIKMYKLQTIKCSIIKAQVMYTHMYIPVSFLFFNVSFLQGVHPISWTVVSLETLRKWRQESSRITWNHGNNNLREAWLAGCCTGLESSFVHEQDTYRTLLHYLSLRRWREHCLSIVAHQALFIY